MCFMPDGLTSAAICQKRLKLHAYNWKLMFDVILCSKWVLDERAFVCVHSTRNEKNWKREKKLTHNLYGLGSSVRLDSQTIINMVRLVKRNRTRGKWHKSGGTRARNMMRYEKQFWVWLIQMKQRNFHLIPVQHRATPSSTQIFYWLFNEHLMVLLIFNMFHFIFG